MAKFGENIVAEMAKLGLDELRNANIPQQTAPEATQIEAPKMSYTEALDRQAEAAQSRSQAPDQGMER